MALNRIFPFILIIVFFLFSLAYSFGPIFEGPDEIEHYRYIRTLQATGQLPAPDGQPYGQFHQAPFYYVLLLPMAMLLPDDDFHEIDGRINPYHGYDLSRPGNDNKNVYLHYRAELFPTLSSPTARAVHVLRLFSIGLGVGTLLFAWASFRLIWPQHPHRQYLALGLLACWPQFTYISSVINNDNAAFFLASGAFYLCIRQIKQGVTWQSAGLLGVVLGLALLTKASLLILAVPIGLITLLQPRTWRYAVLTLVITLLVSGWWYWRNYTLTGDATGIQAMFTTWPAQVLDAEGSPLLQGVERAVFGYRTFWARFGHGAVAVHDTIYQIYDVLGMVALGGLAYALWRGRRQQSGERSTHLLIIFVAAFALIWVFSLILSASIALAGNQGRYLFPGIIAWTVLITTGLEALLNRLKRPVVYAALVIGFALINLTALLGYFYPAYRVLPVPDDMPRFIGLNYENTAELMGMSPVSLDIVPGQQFTVELYWRAIAPQPDTLLSYVHAVDAPHVIRRDSIPGNGHRPAQNWLPGETWAERYVVSIPADLEDGTEYLLAIGLYHPEEGRSLSATDPNGTNVGTTPILGVLRVDSRP